MEARQRLAAAFPHLERALDALAVLRCEPRGGDGVDLRQPRMHGRPAERGGFGVQARAHGGVGRGHGVDAVEQRLEVQHGAAHEQRQRAARADGVDEPRGVGDEGGGAVAVARIEDVDQVVRHRGLLGGGGLGGADVHAAVDQRRVDADDLDRLQPGHGQGDGGLAGRGGAGERDVARGNRGSGGHASRVANDTRRAAARGLSGTPDGCAGLACDAVLRRRRSRRASAGCRAAAAHRTGARTRG
ncbi:hypothetical protein D9M68_497800 [compost metagenome]